MRRKRQSRWKTHRIGVGLADTSACKSAFIQITIPSWDLSHGDGPVLPSVRSAIRPLSENAMNSALRRMGYTKDEMCAHGFRSSASTILNGRHYDSEVIEVALAHQDEDEVRRAI